MTFFRILCIASSVAAAPALAQTVAASRTRLLSWPDPSRAGESVLLQAEVDGLGAGAPTGTVSIADGAVALGSATLSPLGAGQQTVSAGASHSCAISSTGGVKCWGANDKGQIGDGVSTKDRHAPFDVKGLANGVVAVAAGVKHSCALTSAGAVLCWGDNSYGQLGDGTTISRRAPGPVPSLSHGVVAIAAATAHSCALTSAGAVRCWGGNAKGQLGDDSTKDRRSPVVVSGLSSGVVAIAAGGSNSCALTTAGAVKCWGPNDVGEVGDATAITRRKPADVAGLASGVVAIATGYRHSCALTAAGAVSCWGANNHGQIGDGTLKNYHRPVAVVGLSSGVVAIAAGANHSCAVTAGGAAKCWGDDEFGAVGDGATTDRHVPVAVSGLSSGVAAITAGGYHSCATTISGAAYCWGQDLHGQIGHGTTAGAYFKYLTPTSVIYLMSLVRARARLETDALGVGTHRLRASYPGDGAHGASSRLRTHFVVP